MTNDVRSTFRQLHQEGTFVIPNPWDIGSATMLAALGFKALATTSSGHAASLGKLDQHVTRDELLTHAAALAGAVDVPISVDAERCFADDPAGVAETVRLLAETGVAGCSLEDHDPAKKAVDPLDVAVARVAAAADAARQHGLVLTARAEGLLYGSGDLDETIARLVAFRDAGAEVVYAPGLFALDDIARVVKETGCPINVLALPGGPSIGELASVGVRRVSTGGALARAAYSAMERGGRELLDAGTSTYLEGTTSFRDLLTPPA
jgi:2-methylisocitrate lyase-like PEP mutase family enzyme